MGLKIYNVLGKQKENFETIEPGKVKMYVCGPTVYDLLHVGNFRGAIFFNLVRNWLEFKGNEVTFVYNFTDIDDKIIKKANEEGVSTQEISEKYIAEFQKDFQALSLRSHEHNPKATEYIPEMIHFVQSLVEKKAAYVIEGEVFYSIPNFASYGKLSKKNLDDLRSGHRVEVDTRKRSPLDFVLWKPSKENEPGWDSPWGRGRPGWHLECSTMIHSLLGESIDLHGGGIDLCFPHHENEIAQSEAFSEKPLARYWVHNNFIQFNDEKMSKSLGNVIKAREFLEKYNGEILKYLILSVHYRSILNISQEQTSQAIGALARVYSSLAWAEKVLESKPAEDKLEPEFAELLKKNGQELEESLDDDFNTPSAFSNIFQVVRAFNTAYKPGQKITGKTKAKARAFQEWLKKYGSTFSLFQENAQGFLKELDLMLLRENQIEASEIDNMIEERAQARKNKDFERADELRNALLEMGIDLHDSPTGTTWEVQKQLV